MVHSELTRAPGGGVVWDHSPRKVDRLRAKTSLPGEECGHQVLQVAVAAKGRSVAPWYRLGKVAWLRLGAVRQAGVSTRTGLEPVQVPRSNGRYNDGKIRSQGKPRRNDSSSA